METKIKKKRRKKLPKKLTEQEKKKKKLHTTILDIFRYMGFQYIRSDGKDVTIGRQTSDCDNIFLFENIILICEETISENDHDHLRKKNGFFEEIEGNKGEFIKWVKKIGEEKFSKFSSYTEARYKIFYIYVSDAAIEADKKERFPKLKYLDQRSLRYLLKIADCVRFSARNELYKFLGLDFKDIGPIKSSQNQSVNSAVLFPEDVSGMPPGIHIVSFVMTAKELLDCAYVFRKENWEEESGYYYQRLIDKKKIGNIRKFLVKHQRTFIDSIIVSLPKDSTFHILDKNGDIDKPIALKEISSVTYNTAIAIPYKINSIGIIDGQHRVFGHFEGPENKEEKIILGLREKRHLFVTGLYYEKGKYKESDKRKFESKLFLEINSTQKKVGAQILQHIESLQEPLSPIGLAMSIIQKMNAKSPFLNCFILSEIDTKKNGIRTPSIVRYGLQQLVEINISKNGLYKYWTDGKKEVLINEPESDEAEEIRKKYVAFCADSICLFFSAVKDTQKIYWTFEDNSKLLTVTSIVAFIKSFEDAIEKYNGVKDFEFYKSKLKTLKINFKEKGSPYVSSQWSKLTTKINECWI